MDISKRRRNLWDVDGLRDDVEGDPGPRGAPSPESPELREYYNIMAMDDMTMDDALDEPENEPENEHKNSLGRRKRKAEDMEDHDTPIDVYRPHKHFRFNPFDASAGFRIPPTDPDSRPDIPERKFPQLSQHGKSISELCAWYSPTRDGPSPPPTPTPTPITPQPPRPENIPNETSFWQSCRQRSPLQAINYKTTKRYICAFMDEHRQYGIQGIQFFIAGARSRYPEFPAAMEKKYHGSIPPSLAAVLDDLETYADGPRVERVHALEDAFVPPALRPGEMSVASKTRIEWMRRRTQEDLRWYRNGGKEERRQEGMKKCWIKHPELQHALGVEGGCVCRQKIV